MKKKFLGQQRSVHYDLLYFVGIIWINYSGDRKLHNFTMAVRKFLFIFVFFSNQFIKIQYFFPFRVTCSRSFLPLMSKISPNSKQSLR